MRKNLQAIYRGIFPRKIELPEDQQQLLKQLYPSVNWKEVSFYKDLPWFMLNSFAIATVLPARFHRSKLNVYLQSRPKDDFYNLCTLLHEAFHVLQYQELHKRYRGLGWGFCRPFMWHYIGGYVAQLFNYLFKKRIGWKKASYAAYRYHPLEVEAYDQEARFAKLEGAYSLRGSSSDYFVYQNPQVCVKRTLYQKQVPNFFASFFALLFCLLITIIRPLIELLLLLTLYPIILLIGRGELD